MESTSLPKKPHAVCIPLPFQSHINAMLKLAKILYFRGFHVTFVNTEFNHQKVLNTRGPDSLNGLPDFRFESIPDGLPPCDINASQEIIPLCMAVKNNFLDPFRKIIAKLNEESDKSGISRVTCIVADAFLAFPLDVAEELGIPGVVLWTMSAAFLMMTLHCQHLIENGVIPLKDRSNPSKDYLNTPVDLIPGVRDIRLRDLPSYFFIGDNPSEHFAVSQLQTVSKASAIIIQTFDALESEVLEAMKSQLLPPVYAIGPLQLLLQEISNNQYLNSVGFNLWKEDEECLNWLDSKQPNSVIYINFGSLVALTSEKLIEFAWGVANSKHPFLWIIRSNLVSGEAAIMPPEFIKETADRGMISGWCPQEQVLCHSSIGGFLTHSGWNSTVDTICGGVPIISWPFFADQQSNCRYSCAHWGIGIEMDHEFKRDEVEGLVRELMEGERAKELKKKATQWKESAVESIKPGGSSYKNLNRIVEVLVK
ncbi:Udp-glycosyltransferase 85a7 [Thalictrum thalictroides]|uniref:Glycosyltransferase n=1 Tax=Thalictrum thalictroides TaxID=46969 RepID=A0A7J6W1L2_THATH|nr:Udp-glycosyltransferase 85a7 [Thalictrum thalictroides]